MSDRSFVLRCVAESGALITHYVDAVSRVDALKQAERSGLVVLDLKEASKSAAGRGRTIKSEHAILVLRQLAVMIGSGIQLLDAIETLHSASPNGEIAGRLNTIAQALRRGDRFGDALENCMGAYPPYVYGLVRAGEASGQLARVLEEAANQLAFEDRIRRDMANALTYPAFLIVSGVASVTFLLYAVVPRFAAMLENARSQPSGFARFVLDLGVSFNANAPMVLAGVVVAVVGLAVAMQTQAVRAFLSSVAHVTPGLSSILLARQRCSWARVAALSLDAGLGIIPATTLATGTLSEGVLKRNVNNVVPALRAGRPVHTAFFEAGLATDIDASLLHAGQRSGSLGRMLHTIADRHEEHLRDTVKKLTIVIEPLAISIVAIMVGGIVLALASALVGVYETIG